MPRLKGTSTTALSLQTIKQALSIPVGAFDLALSGAELDELRRNNSLENLRLSGKIPDLNYTYDDSSETSADETAVLQLQLALRYTYALAKPTVHMKADLEGLDALSALVSGDTITTACARAVVLAAAWVAHIAGVGSPTVDDEHLAADGTNTLPTNPTDITTLKTWIGKVGGGATGTSAAIIGHGNQSGVHFTSDTGAGGTGFTLSVDPPVTQADCNACLNDIWTAMKTHFNRGTAVLPWTP